MILLLRKLLLVVNCVIFLITLQPRGYRFKLWAIFTIMVGLILLRDNLMFVMALVYSEITWPILFCVIYKFLSDYNRGHL